MKNKLLIVLSLIFAIAFLQVHAERYKGVIMKSSPKDNSECFSPGKKTELSLNNVRALLRTNGTMWFEENVAHYEVPKGSGKTPMFAAALWIGGYDNKGRLYLAAMKFGQDGNDFWTGPLQMEGAKILPSRCNEFDNFYRISRTEVERHINAFKENDAAYKANIPLSIKKWPAIGGPGESQYLAPFCKVEGSDPDPAKYDPEGGDYPYYDFKNELCPWTEENILRAKECDWVTWDGTAYVCDKNGKTHNPKALPKPAERLWTNQNDKFGWDNMQIAADHVLKGDETVFWILNDRGGTHKETKGNSIGLEIRVQAFAFATNDELNKMTFYSYEIINRGSTTLSNTFFSQWVDPDLGYAKDDYVGCDVMRGLGYCYNGRGIDGSGELWAYGDNPPAVGVDFFQGPYIDNDGVDNPHFFKELADIQGTEEQKNYCRRFVHAIFQNIDTFLYKTEFGRDSVLLDKYIISDYDYDGFDEKGKPTGGPNGYKDTIYWNDQFAINGVNFGDGIADNERFGMRRFVYYNNSSGLNGEPDVDVHYMNLLEGCWKNGTKMKYGSNGLDATTAVDCDFMFPRGTDYCNWGTRGVSPGETYGHGGKNGNWSEEHATGKGSPGNSPDDRRFMQSAGPFTLTRGSCNYITVGIPWARATQGGVDASIALLMVADDKCQALFENCFKIIDGPDAPNLTIREYDQKLILLLSNSPLGNNANEDYWETDNTIPEYWVNVIQNPIHTGKDTTTGNDTIIYGPTQVDSIPYNRKFRFEGYQIYQVIGPEVGANDLDDPNLARLVRQFDVENYDSITGGPIGTLINWEFDEAIQVPVPKLKVNGANTGIEHSFEITQDAFATGNKQLVNYKTYYFIAVAYAYNNFWPYSIDPNADRGLMGQKTPYLRGRKTAEGLSVVPIAAVPHPPTLHGGGVTLNCDYGYIPNITRIDGQGNGGIALDLTKETIDNIVRGGDNHTYRLRELIYEKNAGPLNVKVVDPLRLKPFDYTLYIRDTILDTGLGNVNKAEVSNDAYWVLVIDPSVSDTAIIDAGLKDANGNAIREFVSQSTIGSGYEQVILPLGISINIKNVDFVNKQPRVLAEWNRILKNEYNRSTGKEPINLYKAKLMYCQSEKIDINNDIIFENPSQQWITGIADVNGTTPTNWIRAGSHQLGIWEDTNSNDEVKPHYDQWRTEDACFISKFLVAVETDQKNNPVSAQAERAFKDYEGKFATLCGGTWAPYVLTSPYDDCPQAKYMEPEPKVSFSAGEYKLSEPYWYYDFANFLQEYSYYKQPGYNQTMTNLYSVDIVLTSDKDLWTRCIVLESCSDTAKSEGKAWKNEPRKAKSVGKDGKPDGSKDGFGVNGDEGMSWFPGYAINIETGERLNIMFSENSDKTLNALRNSYTGENPVKGNDMWFHPTSTYAVATKEMEFTIMGFPFKVYPGDNIPQWIYDMLYENVDKGNGILKNEWGFERIWGGMHYVYVCNSAGNTSPIYYLDSKKGMNLQIDKFLRDDPRRNFNLNGTVLNIPTGKTGSNYGGYLDSVNFGKTYPNYDCGPYDESRWLVQKFKQVLDAPMHHGDRRQHSFRVNYKMQLFNNVMYTHIPILPEAPELQDAWLSCDVTYKIRVTRPYMRYISRWYESPEERNVDYKVPEQYANQQGYPTYRIQTAALAPTYNDTRLYQSILDNINIVPNPYYGGSFYEKSALETFVKIINLPTDLKNKAPVTINIFTVNGILVRTLTKGDSETTYVNWDLKNYANIPVAGGVYIIHVNCPGIGERMLKFFCTMRPTDLNNF